MRDRFILTKDLTYLNLLTMMNNPKILKLSDFEDDIELAKASIPKIYWGKARSNDTSYVKGNYGIRTALVLDYDHDANMYDWHKQMEGKFEYYIHTSFKHTKEDHRFRVIIPTVSEYWMCDELKKCILDDYPGTDPTCCDNRGFYMPATYNDDYDWCYSPGDPLDIEQVYSERMQAIIDSYPKLDNIDAHKPMCSLADVQFARKNILGYAGKKIDAVDWSEEGNNRYCTMRSVYYFLKQHNDIIDPDDVVELFDNVDLDDKHKLTLSRFMRDW